MRILVAASTLVLLASAGGAIADDWIVFKLRGGVFAYEQERWVQLLRNDVVPDGTVIRSQGNGRAQFVRGQEMVEIAPHTQIQILDQDGNQFTTVKQWYGEIAVDAEARNVEHFAVRTPDLAAVVKGTMFKVGAGAGASEVTVMRGHVAVEDARTHYAVTVWEGQSVKTGADEVMQVAGAGDLPPVTDARGMPVATPAAGSTAPSSGSQQPAIGTSLGSNVDEDAGNGNGNGGGGNGNGSNGGGGNGNGGNGGGNGNGGNGNGGNGNGGNGNGGNGNGGNGGGNGNGGNGNGGNGGGGNGNGGNGGGNGNGGNGNGQGKD